jgi:Fur family ferric uptake transcriptional regulator
MFDGRIDRLVETQYHLAVISQTQNAQSAKPFVAALARAGHRVTAPRRTMADLIARREGHFTAADLLGDAEARRLRIGRATIFRALELYTELNALERIDLPSGEHAYVACEPVHHHHVVCSGCGRTAEVEDHGMQAVAEEISRRTGYRVETHRLELYGLCPECLESAANAGGVDR